MTYTVKKLAQLSGVSTRTLHFYHEIGLLRPASVGENGYRYYEDEQLLLLQQILFFRELGLPLGEIQAILQRSDFDKVTTLQAHREVLVQNLDRTRMLLQTLDKTIARLKGETSMPDTELFVGFDREKQESYEQELIARYGPSTEQHIRDSKERSKNWKKEDWQRVKSQGDGLLRALVGELERGGEPSSDAVQKLIREHFNWVCHFWTPNRGSYTGLGRLYVEHPEFRNFYEPYHPRLVDFLAEAMEIFATRELK